MAKKYKSNKLLKQSIESKQKHVSAFGSHANRLADAKKRKIQKLSDTQKRLLDSKKNNKMIKISKKAKKFALLDQDGDNKDNPFAYKLTHKGVGINHIKEFDDVDFNQSDLENEEEFDKIQDKMNFAGFQATDNLMEKKQTNNPNDQPRHKTKNQVYKQIIQKSKAYKMVRQEIYEENLNIATQLDEGFDQFVGNLKFRNKDKKLTEQMENRDSEYDKLMNQLKEDDRIVSNKIVEKNEKYTERIRKKKNQHLNKLMKDSDGEEDDVRGWVDGAEGSEEDEDHCQSELQQAEQQEDEEINEDDEQQNGQQEEEQQGSYDQLDEVQLSSSEEQELSSGNEQQLRGSEQQNQVDLDQDQNLQDEGDEQLSENENEDQDQEEENKQPSALNKKQPTKIEQQTKTQAQIKGKIPEKKRKLNFVQ